MENTVVSARIQNAEAITLAARLLDFYTPLAEKLGDKSAAAFYGELKTATDDASAATNQDKNTEGLEKADAVRDEAWKTVGKVLEGYSYSVIAELRSHGQPLFAAFDKYGYGVARLNLLSETAKINSFKGDVSTPEMTAHAKALAGAAEALDALFAANDNLEAINKRNTEAAKDAKGKKNATDLKKDIVSIINSKILPFLTLTSQTVGGDYAELNALTSAEIAKVNALITARRKATK